MKTDRIFLAFAMILASSSNITANETDSEAQSTASRTITIEKNFTGIMASSGYVIEYLNDGKPSRAEITGEKSYIEGMTYYVDNNGCLHFENKSKSTNELVKISLNGNMLKSYGASFAGKLRVLNEIKSSGGYLNIEANSSGTVILDGIVQTTGNLKIISNSAGNISFLGMVSALSFEIDANSSGVIKLPWALGETMSILSKSMGLVMIVNCATSVINVNNSSGAKVMFDGCKTSKLTIFGNSASETKFSDCQIGMIDITATTASTVECSGTAQNAIINSSLGAIINDSGLKILNHKVKKNSETF